MPLFQKSVLNKYLSNLDENRINKAYNNFKEYYGDKERIDNIRALKEENYQEGFLREIFVDVLGYTINPNTNYNLTTEYKNETDSKKADGAILKNGNAIGVIELKSTKTLDLASIEKQAFGYKNHQTNCRYIITSNFEKLRFYIDDATDYEEFNLFTLNEERFKIFYLCLNHENILSDISLKIKEDAKLHEVEISKKLYKDYYSFKLNIFHSLTKNNPTYDKLILLKQAQKLLDRMLFIFFAEDRGLLPLYTISKIIEDHKKLEELAVKESLYGRYKAYFNFIDKGESKLNIPEYDGGLFKTDEKLDNLIIDDEVLTGDALKLSAYDFNSDVDVNILGHIFEQSLNDIEELSTEIKGETFDKSRTKRKKEGVFYTPKYITKYIIENTVGALCEEKKKELKLINIDLDTTKSYKRLDKEKKNLLENLIHYRNFLVTLKIIDPACGSGAFLNQALEYLIKEHEFIDEYRRPLEGDYLGLYDVETSILENNLYGVDINEEAVEIAKLSLWLRTAHKGRKLTDLSGNIKCGNSLIDDRSVAGDKAFKWEEEFAEIMGQGGFDVVIGNPPYVRSRDSIFDLEKKYYSDKYKLFHEKPNLFILFIEKSISLIKNNNYFGFIVPNSWLGIESAEELRGHLLLNVSIKSIINLLGESFPGVSVETSILTYKKEKNLDNKTNYQTIYKQDISFNNFTTINQKYWLNNRSFIIDIFSKGYDNKIIDKIKINSVKLSDLYDAYVGLQAYEKGKGKPAQSEKDVKNHIFDYNYKFDENTYKYLNGGDVSRYYFNWSGQWLRHGIWLSQPKKLLLFTSSRLLIREITSPFPHSINACYLDDIFLNNKSILNILQKDKLFSLKYLLLVINSTLMSFFYIRRAVKGNRNLFPKVVASDLKNLPLKPISIEDQTPFIKKADKMLELKKTFNEKKQKFLGRLSSSLNIDNLSKNIDSFFEMDFTGFIKELGKKKVKLSLKQQDEWEDYFNEYKNTLLELKSEIDRTDKEIDQMVHELYELTEEEVKIVEGAV